MSRFLQWSPKFATGVDEIDRQHRELFNRVNRLLAATSQGEGKEEIGQMLEFLASYVVEHFRSEHRYMVQHRYPCTQLHDAQHDRFVADLKFWRGQYETQGANSLLLMDLLHWVSDWLTDHTSGVDLLMGDFLRKAPSERSR